VPGKIVLCEPQCLGFSHACFNSALLKTILLAYPERKVVFMGESEHLDWTRRSLAAVAPDDAEGIEWRSISVPDRNDGVAKVVAHEFRLCREVLDFAAGNDAAGILLTSVTNSGLLALKTTLYLRRFRTPVVAVPHAILRTVLNDGSGTLWRRLTGLGQILRLPHPPCLKYIALGDTIHGHLAEAMPKVATRFHVLDLPFLWANTEIPDMKGADQPVRFGYLGAGYGDKGFDGFHRLACDTRKATSNAEFVMAGFLVDCEECSRYAPEISGVGSSPLPDAEFRKRANGMTYAVFTATPSRYRLVASASFLDSLSFIKPGVYLRNPYVDSYFRRMGDIGYMCDSLEEMLDVIRSLAESFPAERYRQQCVNILKGRCLFEPQTLVPRLREIFGMEGGPT
jgi:hypothetical protein